MYGRLDKDKIFERMDKRGLYTPEVREIREYMDARFGS